MAKASKHPFEVQNLAQAKALKELREENESLIRYAKQKDKRVAELLDKLEKNGDFERRFLELQNLHEKNNQLEKSNEKLRKSCAELKDQAELNTKLLNEVTSVRAEWNRRGTEIFQLNDELGRLQRQSADRQRIIDAFVKLAGRLP